MTLAEMSAWAKSIIDGIERGPRGGPDNKFRMRAEVDLMNAFGSHPEHPGWTVAEVLDDAAAQVRLQVPTFVPRYRDPSVRLRAFLDARHARRR